MKKSSVALTTSDDGRAFFRSGTDPYGILAYGAAPEEVPDAWMPAGCPYSSSGMRAVYDLARSGHNAVVCSAGSSGDGATGCRR